MVALQHKSIPHKASFLPLTVGQKSLFSPLAPLLLSPLYPPTFDPPLLPSSSIPFSSPPLFLLSSPLLFPPPLLPSLLTPLLLPPQGQLVCVELTTRQLLHCLRSPSSCPLHNNTQSRSANHQPGPQQYRTPTWPIGEEVWGEEAPVV